MQKILIITNSINGLYNFRRELVDELLKRESNVIISAPLDTKTNYFREQGCKVIETNFNRKGTNPFFDLKLLLDYIKMVNEVKADVVLSYTIKPNIYGGIACRITGTPQIANITGLGTAVERKSILQTISLKLYKIGLKKSKCIFFQNKENMDFMLKHNIGNENGKLIPGSGVNISYYKLLDYPNSRTINFLFISRIMKQKGINQYLDAARYIKDKYPYTVFHVIGNCEESYNKVLENLDEKEIIKYHGRQENIRDYHLFSNCTIHPTYYPEGISNVLLESAACGRPIITTNRSGCREVVDDYKNGFLVEQQNSGDLIDKIEKFLSLSYEEMKNMGIYGRKKIEENFDRKSVVSAYIKEISQISLYNGDVSDE